MKHLVIENGVPRIENNAATLDDLQRAVGGWIEGVGKWASLTREDVHIMAYCNEEGKLKGLPVNVYADHLEDILVGPVVVIGCDDDGETVGLTDDEIAQVAIVREQRIPLPVLRVLMK